MWRVRSDERSAVGRREIAIDRRRIRILFVAEDGASAAGGMEIRAAELLDALRSYADVALLTAATLSFGRHCQRVHDLRAQARNSFGARLQSSVSWSVGTMVALAEWRRAASGVIRSIRPDVVYLHKFSALAPVAVESLCASQSVVASFADCHAAGFSDVLNGSWRAEFEPHFRVPAIARKAVLKSPPSRPRAVTFLYNCEYLRRWYARRMACFGPQVVLHWGVDAAHFAPATELREGGRFAFLGRASAAKGFPEFCATLAALPHGLVTRIHIIGEGGELTTGLERLRAAGLEDRVGHVGNVPPCGVADVLRDATILMFPSRDEGFPAAVLQGMSAGLAVVATDVGGVSEVVHDGSTGLLVPPGDPTRLADACGLVASDRALRHRLGTAARELIVARLDGQRSIDRHRDLILDGAGDGAITGAATNGYLAAGA